jgi:hypothetical protein
VRWLRWMFGWVAVAGPGLDVLWHTMAMRQIALRRREEKRRRRGLYGVSEGEVEEEKTMRMSRGRDYPLSNFWAMGFRVYVVPLMPTWLWGLAGAFVVGVLGRGWAS